MWTPSCSVLNSLRLIGCFTLTCVLGFDVGWRQWAASSHRTEALQLCLHCRLGLCSLSSSFLLQLLQVHDKHKATSAAIMFYGVTDTAESSRETELVQIGGEGVKLYFNQRWPSPTQSPCTWSLHLIVLHSLVSCLYIQSR